MTKDVIITIRGLQFVQSEDDMEPVEVVTPGEFIRKRPALPAVRGGGRGF